MLVALSLKLTLYISEFDVYRLCYHMRKNAVVLNILQF